MTRLDEVAATIESLPAVLRALLAPVEPAVLTRPPEPGEWSVHEVIGHLITCDVPAFRQRVADIVDGVAEIGAADAHELMAGRDFDAEPLDALIDELAAVRTDSAAFLRDLDEAHLARSATYGENRVFSAGDFVHEWPFHDHDHLQQILANLKVPHTAGMTLTMRQALDVS